MIALIIRQKRKAQYDVYITGKSLSDTLRPQAVKSLDGENSSEIMFPNPTYMECKNYNDEFDQKAD